MISQLTIKNFKKFIELKIEDLSRINLIVGINNVGKTTILEAIMGFASGMNFSSALNFVALRRFPQTPAPENPSLLAELLVNAFHNATDDAALSFAFTGISNGREKSFTHTFNPGQLAASLIPNSRIIVDGSEVLHKQMPMPLPVTSRSSVMIEVPSQYLGKWEIASEGEAPFAYDISSPFQFTQIPNKKPFVLAMLHDFTTYRNEMEISKIYSSLKKFETLDVFVEELNRSFPDMSIRTIENIPYPDGSTATIKVKFVDGGLRPVYALGDGFRRWYELLGGMLTFQNSVHCIEEADATLHHEAQEGFAVNLTRYAQKYNNQIFMTTHNAEYLETFLQAVETDNADCLKNEVRVVTLRHYGDEVRHRTLDGAEALKAIRRGQELRV